MTSAKKTLKKLVWSISSKICPENSHKIGRFLPIAFQQSLPRNSPWNFLQNRLIFLQICPFPAVQSEAMYYWQGQGLI